MADVTVFVPINPDHTVCQHFGRAHLAATCRVADGEVSEWAEHEVDWDNLHDSGEGNHHARIVRFLRDHGVTHVVAGGMGAPMQNTITKLGIGLQVGISGDAKAAAAGVQV